MRQLKMILATALRSAGAAAIAMALTAGCDDATESTSAPTTRPTVAMATTEPVEPAAVTAAYPARPPAVFSIDGQDAIFPAARFAVVRRRGGLTVRLCSDDPPSAIDPGYAGNSFIIDMRLPVDRVEEIPGSTWDHHPADAEDSVSGIFVHGFRDGLRPYDVHVTFQKADDQLLVYVDGTFLRNDTLSPAAPPDRVHISACLRVLSVGIAEMTDRTELLRQLDQQHIWHPFTQHKLWNADDPLVITAADGMHLIDSDGNRYLDGVSSLWCNVHGHRVPEIDSAISAQLAKVAHTTMLGLASEPAILLAQRLMKIVPGNLKKIFYSDSGATATEVAFKLAAQYWHNIGRSGKCEFIGFTEAYHGDTFGAMSVGRTETFHRPYFPLLFKTHFAPTPFVYHSETPDEPAAVRDRCLATLEEFLVQNGERVAALCIEPIVQGAGGMIVQPNGFLRGVRLLCSKYDVLMIADEVAVGFGRTGKMFACEHENVEPDLMCVAKGITGGYLPLAATLTTQKIYDAFLGEPWENKTFFHGHTYTGNPLAAAAALASLDLFEKNDLITHVQNKACVLAELLKPLNDLPHVGDIRQKGFMVGIELVEDQHRRKPFDPYRRIGAAVCRQLRSRGIILRPLGDVIVMMPPLAMGIEDLAGIVAGLREVLKEMCESGFQAN